MRTCSGGSGMRKGKIEYRKWTKQMKKKKWVHKYQENNINININKPNQSKPLRTVMIVTEDLNIFNRREDKTQSGKIIQSTNINVNELSWTELGTFVRMSMNSMRLKCLHSQNVLNIVYPRAHNSLYGNWNHFKNCKTIIAILDVDSIVTQWYSNRSVWKEVQF